MGEPVLRRMWSELFPPSPAEAELVTLITPLAEAFRNGGLHLPYEVSPRTQRLETNSGFPGVWEPITKTCYDGPFIITPAQPGPRKRGAGNIVFILRDSTESPTLNPDFPELVITAAYIVENNGRLIIDHVFQQMNPDTPFAQTRDLNGFDREWAVTLLTLRLQQHYPQV